tara:strand:- start:449 stop:1324 length:876 start_codon:yes stop_codon:yes gene_type:complete
MRPLKYTDFVVSEKEDKRAAHGGAIRAYVTVTCPHCLVAFVSIPWEHRNTNKATECKKHLLVCQAAKDAGVHVKPPVKRKRVAEDALVSAAPEAAPTREVEPADSEDRNPCCVRTEERMQDRFDALREQMAKMQRSIDDQTSELRYMTQTISDNLGIEPPTPAAVCTQLAPALKFRDNRMEKLQLCNQTHAETEKKYAREIDDLKRKLQQEEKARAQERKDFNAKLWAADQKHDKLKKEFDAYKKKPDADAGRIAKLRNELSKTFHPDKIAKTGYDHATCTAVMQRVNSIL